MLLEWDENKRLANLKKHGLDFKDVEIVFNDKNRIVFEDLRKDYGESRVLIVGMYGGNLLTSVCHTDRNGITRIISFRRASKKEKEIYYGQNS